MVIVSREQRRRRRTRVLGRHPVALSTTAGFVLSFYLATL